jgi:integrase
VWRPLREKLGITELPYGLRHSYASLRIHEGASIIEVAEELGHSPQMTVGTYAHVMDELRAAPRLLAQAEIAKRGSGSKRTVSRASSSRPWDDL